MSSMHKVYRRGERGGANNPIQRNCDYEITTAQNALFHRSLTISYNKPHEKNVCLCTKLRYI